MAIIVDINHEAGNLSEYDSTVTDSGDLSAHADAALAGTSYGLHCVINDTGFLYGNVNTFGAQPTTDLRLRFYIDPNSLEMAQFDVFTVLSLFLSNAPWFLCTIKLEYRDGIYKLLFEPYNDAGGLTADRETITDAPHYVEFYIHRSSAEDADDGTAEWWIDGVSKGTWTDIDNYDSFPLWNLARIGAVEGVDAGTTGSLYLDEIVINDDGGEIGPVSEPPVGNSGIMTTWGGYWGATY